MRRTALVVCVLGGLVPRFAEACGGFFCNRVPVDQAGERILFVVGGGRVTAHVQIQYQGPAEDFSWVVPLTAIPEIGVGTDEVFDVLSWRTRPYVAVDHRYECMGVESPRFEGGADADADADGAGDGDSPPPEIRIVSAATVGPFDTVVLDSNDPEALTTWLVENDYDVPATAEPLIADYVSQGSYFLGLKLTKGADAGDLQPIVLELPGIEACIPLRLTGIAAVADMPVQAWFIADGRVVSTNYLEVVPNDILRDWDDSGLVADAVDEAGGRAFVTDFAGSSCGVSASLDAGRYCVDAFRHLRSPQEVMDELARQGFSGTATLLGILQEFMPAPAGAGATDYYDCPSGFESGGLDASGLADAIEARIVRPLREIEGMLRDRPWLTALRTRISPNEMTEDPRFAVNRSLPPVSRFHAALRVLHCADPYTAEDEFEEVLTASGHRMCVDGGAQAPSEVPRAERVIRNAADGPGDVLADNAEAIDSVLAAQLPCAGRRDPLPVPDPEVVPPSCEIPVTAPDCPDGPRGSLCSAIPGGAHPPPPFSRLLPAMLLVGLLRRLGR